MSVDKQGIYYVPTCDGCSEELPREYERQDAVNAVKAEGWRIAKYGDGWFHYCQDCQRGME